MEELASVLTVLEKKFGEGVLMRLDGEEVSKRIEVIPSGSLGLDIALGVGGIPRGRIIEIYGPESSGKTTLALHMASEAQKLGGTVVYIDAEHALDVKYARQLGVDTKKLLVSQPDYGEQAFEIAEALLNTNKVDLIVIDSVAALTPRAELEGDIYDQQPGMQARLMSKALRKITAVAAKSRTTIIFINQIRMKIGVMFGSPETTTGGNALKFYASVRLDVRRIGPVKDSSEVTGNRVKVKVVKNKVAPPFREAEFDVIFNEGISKEGELLDLGVEYGVVDKAGSWYAFEGEKLGQGRDSARLYLKQNADLAKKLEKLILEKTGIVRNIGQKIASVENPRDIKRKKT
ncbi:MAG: recombinase RecA [Deltaproteobacteria bacterium]|nr:recombinase RecA [Deltaproteobacteria bacterium]MCX7952918.1 recombinase RecA [Deltaproteobacteria bacterium]